MFFVEVLVFSFGRLYDKGNTAPAVILPLMPLGVDHSSMVWEPAAFDTVILPLMPLGVDHC
ncbi:hypothetical protein PL9631_1050019 [Planktothrix paucivesiculata PCC 9631]|uniref:Uncharacterized protein n=1 Tax=Planktothrix paucivesiculata PCC 9631 TaxID=671071 RepID=A0A7Z9BIJ6_9CYAN|nr:hypothetical protein PL9631_1050019 [Planktothrix paucivesiculata PCC 9631]